MTPSSPTAVAPGRPVELLIAMGLGDKSLHVVLEEYQQQGYIGIPPDELPILRSRSYCPELQSDPAIDVFVRLFRR